MRDFQTGFARLAHGVLDLLRVPGDRLDYVRAGVGSAVRNLVENGRPLLREAGTGLLRSLRDPVAESVLELFELVQRFLDTRVVEAGAALGELRQRHLVRLDDLEQRIVHAGNSIGKGPFDVALVHEAIVHSGGYIADSGGVLAKAHPA